MRTRTAVVLALLLATFACASGAARADGSAMQRISGAHLTALAARVIHAIVLPPDTTLIPTYRVANQLLPAGRIAVVVGEALRTPAYINVPISLSVNGVHLRTLFVGYRVQRWVQTAVATHDLIAGSVLTASDLTLRRVAFDGQRINGTQALIGRRIEGSFRRGQPIYLEETQTNQIVKAGSTITLIIHDGAVAVAADVVARTSGGLGDEISLYNPKTRTALSGTVVGPDRAELDLGGTP